MANKFEFSKDWALPYWQGKKKHKNYANALDVYQHLSFHFDGYFRRPWTVQVMEGQQLPSELPNPYFMRLIDQNRPSESVVIKDYRRDQYRPMTKVVCSKVVNCLKKIIKSSDWKISYEDSKTPPGLPENDTLYKYCEKNFPKDDSIENWAYKNLVKWLLIDPNALICVMPLSWEVEENEYLRPYPHIIKCKDVLEYKEGEYCVFMSPYKTEMVDATGTKRDGKIMMVVTPDSYYECRQTFNDEDPFEIIEHPHNIGEMPAWIMGGESKSPDYQSPYFDSFVNGMLPALDAAAVDSSDLQAEKVLHLYSLMWAYQTQQCNQCQGMGNVLANGKQSVCPTCEGRGVMPFSPFRVFEINANNPGLRPDANLPTPPIGYVEKDTKIVELMMNIIRSELDDALAAVNMEHLRDRPVNESGVSKAYDAEETNNFVYSIAYHLVQELLVPIYYFVNELRYMTVIPNKETRKQQLPHINVPERYDFLIQSNADDNLVKITSDSNGVSKDIKDAAEMIYAHAKFQDQPDIINRLTLTHLHDPLPGYTTDQVQALVSSGLVDKIDGVLSIYLPNFVSVILAKEPDDKEKFMALDYDKQHAEFLEMAQEKMDALDASKQIMQQAGMGQPQVDAEGNPISQVGQKFKDKKSMPQKKKPDNQLENA